MRKIGIIGGSGLEDPDILKEARNLDVDTPYGKTSSQFTLGTIGNTEVVLVSRHGKAHTTPPTQVNNRAHIWALKELGCEAILATTACGSLRTEMKRGDFVILDQFIDFTRHRPITFFESFEPGEMKHTAMADPFDKGLREELIRQCRNLGLAFHEKGTVVTIEGPRFSTRAESHMFRSWGADVINMSTAPEAILANELEIPYAAVAMCTDYDCWKEDEPPATWEQIVKIFEANVHHVISLLQESVVSLG
jgi:5'-methylthioadenosine phosphorylase